MGTDNQQISVFQRLNQPHGAGIEMRIAFAAKKYLVSASHGIDFHDPGIGIDPAKGHVWVVENDDFAIWPEIWIMLSQDAAREKKVSH